jgi:hypothetical protein
VSLALMPLGCVLAGPAASVLGAPELLLGGALVALVVLPLGLLPRETRMLERLDGERPAPVALAEAPAGVRT